MYVATKYFENQKPEKAMDIEARKEAIKNKPHKEPLPVDYLIQLREQHISENTKSSGTLVDSAIPDAVGDFTHITKQ